MLTRKRVESKKDLAQKNKITSWLKWLVGASFAVSNFAMATGPCLTDASTNALERTSYQTCHCATRWVDDNGTLYPSTYAYLGIFKVADGVLIVGSTAFEDNAFLCTDTNDTVCDQPLPNSMSNGTYIFLNKSTTPFSHFACSWTMGTGFAFIDPPAPTPPSTPVEASVNILNSSAPIAFSREITEK